MQIKIVSYDHFMVTSEGLGLQRLKSKESSEILELGACFLEMVCCRRNRVQGKLNTSRDYLLIESYKRYLFM